MKQIAYLLTVLVLFSFSAQSSADDKPIKHVEVEDISVASEAKNVFNETTLRLKSMQSLNAQELHDIHMITYSLEKAVAYYVINSNGERKTSAEEIAEVVEKIHLASENGRSAQVRAHLDVYFELADEFAKEL